MFKNHRAPLWGIPLCLALTACCMHVSAQTRNPNSPSTGKPRTVAGVDHATYYGAPAASLKGSARFKPDSASARRDGEQPTASRRLMPVADSSIRKRNPFSDSVKVILPYRSSK